MANATTADARAGYDIFRRSGGELDLPEINRELERRGHGPIRDRTLRHYRNLMRTGYDRYISVNRFDVARASRPYENASSSVRYRYLPTEVEVRMTLAQDGELVEVNGTASRIGEVGARLVFNGRGVASALSAARIHSNQSVRLDFHEPHRSTTGRIIEVDVNDEQALVEVEFGRLQSVVEYTGRAALDTDRVLFRVMPGSEDDDAADLIGRRIYFFLEVIESSRAVVNEYLTSAGSDQFAAPATIERLRVESPAEFVMAVPMPVTAFVGTVTPLIGVYYLAQRARLLKYDADGRSESVRSSRIDNDVAEAQAQAQIAAFDRLRNAFGADVAPSERLTQLFQRDVLRSIQSLAAQDVSNVETDTSTDEVA